MMKYNLTLIQKHDFKFSFKTAFQVRIVTFLKLD